MEKEIGHLPLILLAGGRSSRMGWPKGLLDYQGQPWLIEQLRRFKSVSGKQTIVVLGFHRKQYFEQIPWLEKGVSQPVQKYGLNISVALNPDPEQGQFSSLQCAIALMQGNLLKSSEFPTPNSELFFQNAPVPGAFLLPIDVPCPGKEVFGKLVEAFDDSLEAVIPQYQTKGGHPVLLGADFLLRLAEIPLESPCARLDLQIQALPAEQTRFVPVRDKTITLNMNSLAEFQGYAGNE